MRIRLSVWCVGIWSRALIQPHNYSKEGLVSPTTLTKPVCSIQWDGRFWKGRDRGRKGDLSMSLLWEAGGSCITWKKKRWCKCKVLLWGEKWVYAIYGYKQIYWYTGNFTQYCMFTVYTVQSSLVDKP